MRAIGLLTRRILSVLLLTLFFLGSVLAQMPSQIDFSGLDAQVRSLKKPSSPTKLVSALSQITHNDWERARAIYIWLTDNIAYDADGFFGKRKMVSGLDQAFAKGVSVCQGYSDLFTFLANGLGMTCVTVSGYAKAYGYTVGQKMNKTNHAWNKVAIDGYWYLMDATWGAGHLDGASFVKSFTDSWFGTDPRLFVLNHFPETLSNALLKGTFSLQDYLSWPYISTWQVDQLLSLGFSPNDIIQAWSNGQLPEVYGIGNATITYCAMPLMPVRNTVSHFELAGINITDVALIQDGNWTFLRNQGDRFSLDVRLSSPKVSVVVKVAGQGNRYSGLVDLQVR